MGVHRGPAIIKISTNSFNKASRRYAKVTLLSCLKEHSKGTAHSIKNSSLLTHISLISFSFLVFREIVLGRVAALVKKFVRQVSIARGLSEQAANIAGGKIFTFGSYRLGVHGPGADIDTLCVVPKHVSREDFFEVLEPMLKDLEGATEVSVRANVYLIRYIHER